MGGHCDGAHPQCTGARAQPSKRGPSRQDDPCQECLSLILGINVLSAMLFRFFPQGAGRLLAFGRCLMLRCGAGRSKVLAECESILEWHEVPCELVVAGKPIRQLALKACVAKVGITPGYASLQHIA